MFKTDTKIANIIQLTKLILENAQEFSYLCFVIIIISQTNVNEIFYYR